MKANTIECGRQYVLWDGACGFCRRCVEIMARLDERSTFVLAPYQSFSSDELRKVGLDYRHCARELQVVSGAGKAFGGAFAINYFLWQQSRWRLLVVLGFLFPILFLMEVLFYKIVAGNRRLFSQILFPGKE